ncbi:MAG: hypothetical protein HRU50_15940 [Winogradskyella sp.]|uniref:hypothetical protein n=1 Tax=Winogradskyella sp. TaxID=1883156 RepID=UPI0025E44CBD|nr:hypothetical protein [Winogradskyella sp.]NRB61411.1 hypothetical protein [Winogradskyella sp.]
MKWLLKHKAGALQLTTYIIIVIALLLTGFILLIHTHKQFVLQSDTIIHTIKSTDEGIRYALNQTILPRDTFNLKSTEIPNSKLKLHKDNWGVFEKVKSISSIRNKTFQKVALLGSTSNSTNRSVLYLEDNSKPLVVVGNTKINGLAYLPKPGVKAGSIAGHSYYGSQLIYGSTKVSKNLPAISKSILNEIQSLINVLSHLTEDQFLSIKEGVKFSNSFKNALQIIYSDQTINLNDIELTGHIIVQSKTKIVVDASSQLKDVLLVASEVEIKPNVVGSFQAIATKAVSVAKNVQLNYPSALVLHKKPDSKQAVAINPYEERDKITIEENTTIKGAIVFLGEDILNNYNSQIELKENSKVYGELYCNQNIDLKGKVFGTVYTHNFIAKQSGSVYQNHIYNGVIDIDALPEQYSGLLFNDSKKVVAKWLY